MDIEIYIVAAIIGACFLAAVIMVIRKIIKGDIKAGDKGYEEWCRNHHLTDEDRPDIKVPAESLPEELRALAPLAEKWGISDDVIRINCIKAASPEEREELLSAVEQHRSELTAWLENTDVTQSEAWTAVAFMETAAAEMKTIKKEDKNGIA